MARKKSPALRSVGDALTSPQTRQERYLANIAGLVATKPEYPFTRLERYLDAIAQSTGGLAEAIEELNQNKLNVYGRGVNLLDNWYFVGGGQFPINQRGQTIYSATSPAAYCIDRWKVSFSTAVVTSTGIQLSNSGGFGLLQVLDPAVWDVLVGKTVTLSFLVSALSDAATLYASDAEVAQTTQAGLITATFQVPAGIADASKFIAIRGNCTLIAGKLELGKMQTLAHQDAGGNWVLNDPPPNFQQELAKCQRYMLAFSNPSNAVKFLGFGRMGNTTQARIKILTPVTMVKQPTVVGNLQLYFNNNAEPVSITSFGNLWQPDASGFYLNGNVAAQTVGAFCICILQTGQSVVFDANI